MPVSFVRQRVMKRLKARCSAKPWEQKERHLMILYSFRSGFISKRTSSAFSGPETFSELCCILRFDQVVCAKVSGSCSHVTSLVRSVAKRQPVEQLSSSLEGEDPRMLQETHIIFFAYYMIYAEKQHTYWDIIPQRRRRIPLLSYPLSRPTAGDFESLQQGG